MGVLTKPHGRSNLVAAAAHQAGAQNLEFIMPDSNGPGTDLSRTRTEVADSWLPGVPGSFLALSSRILSMANRGVPRVKFLRSASHLILDFTECALVELRVWGGDVSYRWRAQNKRPRVYDFELSAGGSDQETACRFEENPVLERICRAVARGDVSRSLRSFTRKGSFWCSDTSKPVSIVPDEVPVLVDVGDSAQPVAVIAFTIDDRSSGLMVLAGGRLGCCTEDEIVRMEELVKTIGQAIADRRAQAALRERVKELACLYSIAQLAGKSRPMDEELLSGVAEQLRVAFQYPDSAAVHVSLDGLVGQAGGWEEGGPTLQTDIAVGTEKRGAILVNYPSPGHEIEIDPFLPEETNLIEAVSRQIALLAERHQAGLEKNRLTEQLRHADRLATIGQISAGLAHELHEPLARVLGFAQLAARASDLPGQVAKDIGRIEKAALHAREVIRKLMLFARQTPPRTDAVSLNELVQDGLFFLEGRCAKNGIELERSLDKGLPDVAADSSQLLQVLVNLVVNAMQAMPHGGRLTIATSCDDDRVRLEVSDTGVGMTDEVRRRLFEPFFTTKDLNEGTGLGLAVVHGIVAAHGGTIEVESTVGVGSRFTVSLPRTADSTDHGNPAGGD